MIVFARLHENAKTMRARNASKYTMYHQSSYPQTSGLRSKRFRASSSSELGRRSFRPYTRKREAGVFENLHLGNNHFVFYLSPPPPVFFFVCSFAFILFYFIFEMT